MTPFSELAMRIAEDITGKKSPSVFGEWYLCESLPEAESDYIKDYFKPTASERLEFGLNEVAWLSNLYKHPTENNSFRILILLMAERHWLEYENE